jgi:predicted nucleic acid-binding protein
MPAFWDASAVLPLCVPGLAGARGRQLLRDHKPVVWWGTPVEVACAIARLKRAGRLGPEKAQAASGRLEMLRRAWRELQPVSEVRELAQVQVERYELRAADALQLAAALVWCRKRPNDRNFLCRDRRLGQAAQQAGFTVIEF